VIGTMDTNQALHIIEDRVVRLLQIVLDLPEGADAALREWAANVDLRDLIDPEQHDVGYNAIPLLLLDMTLGRVGRERGLPETWAVQESKRLGPQLLATWTQVFDEGHDDYETLCALDADGHEIELEDVVQAAYDRIMAWVAKVKKS
jgi:hypothetical protein